MRLSSSCLWFVLLLVMASPGCAPNQPETTEVRWEASSGLLPDKTGEWSYLRACPGGGPEFQDGFLRINTLDYRDISDRSGYGRNFKLTMPRRFIIEARLRVVEELCDPFSIDHCAVIAAVVAPYKQCTLTVGRKGLRLNNQDLPLPRDLQEPDEFHTYRMEVEGTLTVLYVDGVETGRAPLVDNPSGLTPSISWGDTSRFASGISDWEYVWHNAGQ